jgi:hypothetical protein
MLCNPDRLLVLRAQQFAVRDDQHHKDAVRK